MGSKQEVLRIKKKLEADINEMELALDHANRLDKYFRPPPPTPNAARGLFQDIRPLGGAGKEKNMYVQYVKDVNSPSIGYS